MSFRCVWIVSLSKKDHGKILLFRRFPTVEKRCESLYGDDYVALPTPEALAIALLVKARLSSDAKQFVDWRDGVNKPMQLPVMELTIGDKELWPIIAITQSSYVVCCMCFVENYKDIDKKNLLQLPSVSVGFSVLLAIINVFGMASSADSKLSKLTELENFLSLSMPFGTPSDLDISCVSYIYKYHSQKFYKKQPAWKPFDYKGKQQIHINIMECVRSVQWKTPDVLETFGQVSVKADLEGAVNDVTISLSPSDAGHPLSLDSIVIHPCVSIHGGPSLGGSGLPKRFRFSPPLHEFVLFQYCSLMPKESPIQGVFKMRGEASIELFIQLKLNDKIKNNFDFCDVIIVFFNRGPAKNIEFNTNHGSVKLLEDKYALKWSLGSKFPKELETALTVKVEFNDGPILPNSDPFCIDKNSYAQINFKQSNATLSGCNIDHKSITVSEGIRPKISIERSFQSAEYRLWNCIGDVPFSTQILNKFNKILS